MNTQPIGPFRGLNNRLPDYALQSQDGSWLKEAVNVDIDNAGRVRSRDGVTLIQAMTGAHSVFATSATTGYLVRASVLYSFTTSPSYSETLLKILTVNTAVHYHGYNGSLYYSNGTDSGRVEAGVWFPWALPTPDAPTTATTSGGLHVGGYQVAVRYYNSVTGEAGGISASTTHETTADPQGVRVTLPAPTSGATHVQVFISRQNGSEVYLHSSVATGTSVLDIVSIDALTTTSDPYFASPMPACNNLFVHMGRLCGTSGSRLYYGLAYRFGYYEASDGYIDFEDDVQVAVPNQFGVYVATETNTYWFLGDLSKVERISDPLPYGGQFGTAFRLPHKKLVGWFGANGFVIGDEQGQVTAMMQEAVDVTPDNGGWSATFSNRGYRRVVSNGYCMNLETGAVSTYADYAVTSASGGFGTKADGLYSLTGEQPVDAHIDLGKQNFGAENLKHMPACYIGVSSETPMELRVSPSDDEVYEYTARSCSLDTRIQRVDVGRGLRSNWFNLSIHNTEGSDFTLASVSFAPVASGRRI